MAAAQLGLSVLALVIAVYLVTALRVLAKSQRGTRAELRRLRRRQEAAREEQRAVLGSLGFVHSSLELVQRMIRARPRESEVELERVDWDREG